MVIRFDDLALLVAVILPELRSPVEEMLLHLQDLPA
jgi:hypothetical protein